MSKSSLSTVVSTLVRASMGSSVSSTVTDEELDRHVADLILKEAKQKAERYLHEGVNAYLPSKSDANVPKTNKRFLSSIIRNTDEHNKAVLRAQADAAQEAKIEREEQERKERRSRAMEAAEAGRLRRLMGGTSYDRWNPSRDGKRRERKKGTSDDEDDYDNDRRRSRRISHRSRSGSRDREKSRHRGRSRYEEDRREGSSRRRKSGSRTPISSQKRDVDHKEGGSKHKHKRSRSKTPEKSHKRHRDDKQTKADEQGESDGGSSSRKREKGKGVDYSQTPSTSISGFATPNDDDDQPRQILDSPLRKQSSADLSSQFKLRKTTRESPPPPASPTLSEEEDIGRFRPRKKLTAANSLKPPGSPSSLPSKMDKYFEESYDPRLDTGPMTVPTIPNTGLIDGPEFESWEAMLDIIRQRREDKAERKRLQRLGLLPDKEKKEKKVKEKIEKSSDAWSMDTGTSIMDIQYSKKGAVREWDMGKEGF